MDFKGFGLCVEEVEQKFYAERRALRVDNGAKDHVDDMVHVVHN